MPALVSNSLVILFFLASLGTGKAQGQLETVVQRGHALAVRAVTFSPDGKFLASGSEDKTIKIWEFNSGRELKTLIGHQSYVYQVLFTSSGKQLISSSRDNHIYIWDISSGEILKTFHYPDESIVSIVQNPIDKFIKSFSLSPNFHEFCVSFSWNHYVDSFQ